ncbi:hypothetical protein NLJ89_g1234 [Agrocybe chaxingu]|uniref:Dopey N-terminal domain-containing protein n=1 Tax=Agrocybe chaxingu TaxID=84603 RepID=A0A9W8N0H5_9AGAR|nr:hypothetical protein NLJ89_g1234 [Agrocybe chaxingu]
MSSGIVTSDNNASGNTFQKGSARVSTRTSERSLATQAYSSDPKYKKYVQQVEKCLNSFDNVHEWADCIAFLKQLLKTFQSYMQFKEIPRKLIVAKRLSQCLNPALPTGVHQRALEVYVHILAVLGVEGLKHDLALWSPGLFPFFEYAATSVKPTLLNIYDTHYIPLQADLRPIMKSFILALLPGLEEETGEFFDKVLSLLDRLSGAVAISFFFQNIWLVMLTTPSARGTSLNFLGRRLPRLNVDEDISGVVGKDIGLMIRAFAAALEDENLLVRRAALDILLQSVRVNSHTLRKAHQNDRAILMRAATGVVLRRDLSLNRRLYTWLLGTDEKSENQIAYLKENSLELLSSTLKSEMSSPSGEYAESRPFKILISLLDKWEIGAPLTEVLVYDSFKAVMDLVQHPVESGEDLTMTANTLYEAVEPQLLWKHLLSAIFKDMTGDATETEATRLIRFILKSFSQDEEVQTIHLPVVFSAIIDLMAVEIQTNPSKASSDRFRETIVLLDDMTITFTTVDRMISLAIALHRNQYLDPKLDIHERVTVYRLVTALLKYLGPECTPYQVRAVNLIWSIQSSTTRSHVESILAQSLTSPESRKAYEAYEAFGVLWRLSDDTLLPGFYFKVPMMIVLDALKSDKPGLRRIGETWMRCSLKSYIRILDPILHDLLDPGIVRSPTTFKVRGRELPGFSYERAFDQRIMNHLLETLLSIVSFGGQGFTKAARTSSIKRSHHIGLVQRVTSSGFGDTEATYLDVLIETLLRFVQSEPNTTLAESMQPLNNIIQSNAIELLQAIVSRGDTVHGLIETVEATTIGKLYFSIHTGRLDLQNKWLHLLHSVISVSTALLESARRPANDNQEDTVPESASVPEKTADPTLRYPMNPLMIQTLVDGISTRSNRPVLQHWLDFILMAVPQFQPTLQAVVTPLNDCLCRQVLSSLGDVLRATTQMLDYADDTAVSVSDAELIMLLNGLERLILLSLAYTSEMDSPDDEANTMEKSTADGGGLLGYVSNVFSSESSSANQTEQLTSRSAGYRSLDEGIRVLYSVWASLVWKAPHEWSPKDDSFSLIYNRSRLRCRRVLEHLFRVQSAEVFESIIDWWSRDQTLSVSSPDAAFELVDVLVANAQNAVHMICESISIRILGSSEKNRKQAINPNLTDNVLFKFLEQYLRRLEGPLVVQVWGRFIQLIKEILSASRDFKLYNFPALKYNSFHLHRT